MRKNLHGRVDAAPKNRMARARSNTAVQLSSLRCPREGIAHRFLGNFAVALDVGSWPGPALSGSGVCWRGLHSKGLLVAAIETDRLIKLEGRFILPAGHQHDLVAALRPSKR